MSSANDFVDQVNKISGIAGCLLVKDDGILFASTLDNPELYSTLMEIVATQVKDVMASLGFSYCRHLRFNRPNRCHFFIFPVNNYLLGVVVERDCSVPYMLEAVNLLIERVSTSRSKG